MFVPFIVYLLPLNTRTVLAIVPTQGCEAILIEILQSKGRRMSTLRRDRTNGN